MPTGGWAGQGSYSIAVGIWAFALAGLLQTAGFLLRLREIGLLPPGSQRRPGPALPLPGAVLAAVPWLCIVVYFAIMLKSGGSSCSPITLEALTVADGVNVAFFSKVGLAMAGKLIFMRPCIFQL
jgi:hypothetical protein